MNIHVSYKAGKTPDVEREFQIQIQKLERRLRAFNPDLVHLHAIVDPQNGQGASTSLNLRLPSGQLTVQKSGENMLAALKAAFSDLVSQLTRHKDLLRGEWTRKLRKAGRGPESMPASRFRQAPAPPARPGAGAAFPLAELESWIGANMAGLNAFIERELQFRAVNGQIREDQIAPQEVLDEVIVSALSQEDGGGRFLSPESWFHRLALQAIRRLIADNADVANVSLDSPARAQNVTGSDENALQYHQPDDQPQEESVIRDVNVRTPEEIFANEEMVAQLDLVLRGVGAQDREAFILFTLEGFTVEEIARLSDRHPDEVRKSIHHARKRVQQKMPEQGEFRGRLLNRSRVA